MTDIRKLQADIKALVGTGTPPAKTLPKRAAAAPLRPIIAAAKPKISGSASAGLNSGIAAPLTEPDYTDRTYHDLVTYSSTDGLFTMRVSPLASITMQDALDREVTLVFDEPA